MKRDTKIILIVGGSLILACLLACGTMFLLLPQIAQRTVAQADDPTQAKKIAAQIADYILPPGYQEQMGFDLFIEKIVMLAPTNGRGTAIMLLQMPATVSRQQMEQQMRQSLQNQFGQVPGTFKNVGEHQVTIKGQTSTLTVSESATATFAMRQATGFFVGKGGLVMMMLTGEVDNWNWTLIENFCASIR